MSRAVKALICLLLLMLLAISNPTVGEYASWVTSSFIKAEGIEGHPGTLLVSAIGKPMVAASTTSYNCFICTVFVTSLGDETVTALGILRNFIPLYTR